MSKKNLALLVLAIVANLVVPSHQDAGAQAPLPAPVVGAITFPLHTKTKTPNNSLLYFLKGNTTYKISWSVSADSGLPVTEAYRVEDLKKAFSFQYQVGTDPAIEASVDFSSIKLESGTIAQGTWEATWTTPSIDKEDVKLVVTVTDSQGLKTSAKYPAASSDTPIVIITTPPETVITLDPNFKNIVLGERAYRVTMEAYAPWGIAPPTGSTNTYAVPMEIHWIDSSGNEQTKSWVWTGGSNVVLSPNRLQVIRGGANKWGYQTLLYTLKYDMKPNEGTSPIYNIHSSKVWIVMKAADPAGNMPNARTDSFIVDSKYPAKPTLSGVSRGAKLLVNQPVTISGTALDAEGFGLARIELSVLDPKIGPYGIKVATLEGDSLPPGGSYSFTWNGSPHPSDGVRLWVAATDWGGNQYGSDQVGDIQIMRPSDPTAPTSFSGTTFNLADVNNLRAMYVTESSGSEDDTGSALGEQVIFADLDGDGKEELIATAPWRALNGNPAGAVYVIPGNDPHRGVVDLGDSANYQLRFDGTGFDMLGASVVITGANADANTSYYSDFLDRAMGTTLNAGDIDGDGKTDLMIGAPNSSVGGTHSGSLYVIYGSKLRELMQNSGSAKNIDLTQPGNYSFRLDGGPSYRLGQVSLGDLNRDGRLDLIVGAPAAMKSSRGGGIGQVYVFYSTASLSGNVNITSVTPDVKVVAGGFVYYGGYMGVLPPRMGDLDGDGRDDLVFGAPFAKDFYQKDNAQTSDGYVYILYELPAGPAVVDVNDQTSVGSSSPTGIKALAAKKTLTYIDDARWVPSIGDIDNDGVDDMIVIYGDRYEWPDKSDRYAYIVYGHAKRFNQQSQFKVEGYPDGYVFPASLRDISSSYLSNGGGGLLGGGANLVDANGDGNAEIFLGGDRKLVGMGDKPSSKIFVRPGGYRYLQNGTLYSSTSYSRQFEVKEMTSKMSAFVASMAIGKFSGGALKEMAIGSMAASYKERGGGAVFLFDNNKIGLSPDTQSPTFKISAPAAGENLSGGGSTTIKWESTDDTGFGMRPITLSYSQDGGATFPNVIIANTTDEAYVWTPIPAISNSTVRLKIEGVDASGKSASAVSDLFSIGSAAADTTAPTVSLTAPVTADLVYSKEGKTKKMTITWTATDTGGFGANPISIFYSLDGGQTFDEAQNVVVRNLSNSGTYTWDLTAGPTPADTSRLRVRVKAVDAAGNAAVADSPVDIIVDSTLPVVKMLTPTLDQRLNSLSDSVAVAWEVSDAQSGLSGAGQIYYTTPNSGTSYGLQGYTDGRTSHTWAAIDDWAKSRNVTVTSSPALIKVSVTDKAGNTAIGLTDPFYFDAGISTTSPAAGSSYKTGDTIPITWQFKDGVTFNADTVKIMYSPSSKEASQLVADKLPLSPASYSFAAPQKESSTFRIIVFATDSTGKVHSSSSAYLTISQATASTGTTALAVPTVAFAEPSPQAGAIVKGGDKALLQMTIVSDGFASADALKNALKFEVFNGDTLLEAAASPVTIQSVSASTAGGKTTYNVSGSWTLPAVTSKAIKLTASVKDSQNQTGSASISGLLVDNGNPVVKTLKIVNEDGSALGATVRSGQKVKLVWEGSDDQVDVLGVKTGIRSSIETGWNAALTDEVKNNPINHQNEFAVFDPRNDALDVAGEHVYTIPEKGVVYDKDHNVTSTYDMNGKYIYFLYWINDKVSHFAEQASASYLIDNSATETASTATTAATTQSTSSATETASTATTAATTQSTSSATETASTATTATTSATAASSATETASTAAQPTAAQPAASTASTQSTTSTAATTQSTSSATETASTATTATTSATAASSATETASTAAQPTAAQPAASTQSTTSTAAGSATSTGAAKAPAATITVSDKVETTRLTVTSTLDNMTAAESAKIQVKVNGSVVASSVTESEGKLTLTTTESAKLVSGENTVQILLQKTGGAAPVVLQTKKVTFTPPPLEWVVQKLAAPEAELSVPQGTIALTVSDPDRIKKVTVSRNDQSSEVDIKTVAASGEIVIPVTGLSRGDNAITVVVEDTAGAMVKKTVTVKVSAKKPILSVLTKRGKALVSGALLTPEDTTLNLSVKSDSGASLVKESVKVIWDRKPLSASDLKISEIALQSAGELAVEATLPSLQPGSHMLSVQAQDALGNVVSLDLTDLKLEELTLRITDTPKNFPNPFSPLRDKHTVIMYTLSQDADMRLFIFDAAGQMVVRKNIMANTVGGKAGLNEVPWDGRSDYGYEVGNGVYSYTITDGSKVLGRGQLTVVR